MCLLFTREKVFFRNSKGLMLAGILDVPEKDTDFVLIIAHGFTSGKDRTRIVNLAKKINEKGFAVFRFDFGGHGESGERVITIKDQVDDFNSAIDFMISKGYKKVGIFGASFGGHCAVRAYSDKVDAVILWAANTKPWDSDLYTDEAKREIKEKGYVDFEKPGEKFKIGEDYFIGVKDVSQEKLLSNVKIPALVLHGSEDGLVPLEDSEDALRCLPKGSKLKIVNGAGHGFGKHLDEVSELVTEWLLEKLMKEGCLEMVDLSLELSKEFEHADAETDWEWNED